MLGEFVAEVFSVSGLFTLLMLTSLPNGLEKNAI